MLLGEVTMRKTIVALLTGEHTSRPYRIIKYFREVNNWFEVEGADDYGAWHSFGEFDTVEDAHNFIKKTDLNSALEIDEIKFNIQ